MSTQYQTKNLKWIINQLRIEDVESVVQWTIWDLLFVSMTLHLIAKLFASGLNGPCSLQLDQLQSELHLHQLGEEVNSHAIDNGCV